MNRFVSGIGLDEDRNQIKNPAEKSAGLLLYGWVSKYQEINFPTQY